MFSDYSRKPDSVRKQAKFFSSKQENANKSIAGLTEVRIITDATLFQEANLFILPFISYVHFS